MEPLAVVRIDQMAELVGNYIVHQFLRKADQVHVQVDVPQRGTAAPVPLPGLAEP